MTKRHVKKDLKKLVFCQPLRYNTKPDVPKTRKVNFA